MGGAVGMCVGEVGAVASRMAEKLNWFLATERRRTALIVPLWAVAIALAFAQALFQRAYLTIFDYGLVVAICLVCGALISDFAKALVSFVVAMATGMLILFALVILPTMSSVLPSPTGIIIQQLWVGSIFTSAFPFPFIAFLIATVIGSALAENYL